MIVRDALNLIVAREKVGKSILSLGLSSLSPQVTLPMPGLKLTQGRVLYIDAGDGAKVAQRLVRRLH